MEQLPQITELLAESGLPTEDLCEQDLSLFLVEESSEGVHAVGGLERHGNLALLRSIATSAVFRGHGMAGGIIVELERLAKKEGFEELYLLTESTVDYFESKGYVRLKRSEVPVSIRNSRQFSSLCPDSATVMCKRIRE